MYIYKLHSEYRKLSTETLKICVIKLNCNEHIYFLLFKMQNFLIWRKQISLQENISENFFLFQRNLNLITGIQYWLDLGSHNFTFKISLECKNDELLGVSCKETELPTFSICGFSKATQREYTPRFLSRSRRCKCSRLFYDGCIPPSNM